MFTKEYLGLLVLAAILAFPLSYVLMEYWMKDHIEQTSISTWTYFVIFFGMALIITFYISWRACQGFDYKQLRLQNHARSAEGHEQVRQHPGIARTDQQGEDADTLYESIL